MSLCRGEKLVETGGKKNRREKIASHLSVAEGIVCPGKEGAGTRGVEGDPSTFFEALNSSGPAALKGGRRRGRLGESRGQPAASRERCLGITCKGRTKRSSRRGEMLWDCLGGTRLSGSCRWLLIEGKSLKCWTGKKRGESGKIPPELQSHQDRGDWRKKKKTRKMCPQAVRELNPKRRLFGRTRPGRQGLGFELKKQ